MSYVILLLCTILFVCIGFVASRVCLYRICQSTHKPILRLNKRSIRMRKVALVETHFWSNTFFRLFLEAAKTSRYEFHFLVCDIYQSLYFHENWTQCTQMYKRILWLLCKFSPKQMESNFSKCNEISKHRGIY